MNGVPRSVKLLIAGATLLGIGCVAIRLPQVATWDLADVAAVVVIAGLTIVTERRSIPLRRGTETVNFAMTDGVWAGALLLVSPSVLTISVLLGVGVGQAMNRWKPYKIAYNVSQFLIAITLAEVAFAILSIWGGGPADPITWIATMAAMYVAFVVNATAIMLVVSMVEGTRFLDVFRLPLSLNVVHWLANMALGILGAFLWTVEPAALVLMIAPVALTDMTYRRWVEGIRERDQMRDLYEAGRALSGPLASTDDFGGFLGLLEKLLPADRVELVVVDGNRVAVHASAGVRYLTVDEGDADPLEAFVAVRSGIAPQIALVGDGQDVRGVLAVYRPQLLTASERLLLDGLADQIAARLQDHRVFGKTLERARLSEIVAHTSDGVFTIDRLGRITTWNPAMEALAGFPEVEALGRRCEDLLGLDREAVFSDDNAVDGEPRDTAIRTRRGDEKQVRLRTSVIRDEEGAPPARIAVVRDAGEEARAEQIKRDFVSMVSHELRTPLTPLKGFLMSLVEGTIDDSAEKRQEYYRIMLRQAQRLERTVNDMLDASQIEAGGLVVDLQPVPLPHVLGRLVKEFREQHPTRTVVLGEVGRPAIVLADPFRVEQVVLNLLSNADKYTPEDLPISVSAVRTDHEVTISVRDRGEGIPPEYRDRIFDRFFRVKDGNGPRRPGTGLGLYIAKTLVEAMSGRIWVYSKEGVGTTFSFGLPVVELAQLDGDARVDLPMHEEVPLPLVRSG
ncbi:MAG TPA: ATP-binding protein [Actinomycetota bacterium]|nr:ATP-binding protein [Actinomycetota bacterium]